MEIKIGSTALITCDNWFTGKDGKTYRVVFGTVKAILDDTDTLGIRTNAKSTNWYVQIGRMVIAGCQIHYAISVDREDVNFGYFESSLTHDGQISYVQNPSVIYDADN